MKNINKEILNQIEVVRKSVIADGWYDYYSARDVEKLIEIVLEELNKDK